MNHAIRRAVAMLVAVAVLSVLASALASPAFAATPRIVASVLDPNPVQWTRCRVNAQVLDNHGRAVRNVVVTFVWKVDGHIAETVKAKTNASGIARSSGHVNGGVPWRLDSVGISARVGGKKLLAPAYFQPLPAIWPGHPVTIRIGIAAPMTEDVIGIVGQGMARGALLAIEQYNTSQTVSALGLNFMGMVADDHGDPAAAVAAAKHLAADPRLLGVMGHFNSGCSIPASAVYQKARVPMISPTSTNPALTQQGRNNVFRGCASDNTQGEKGGFLAYELGKRRAYVVDDSTPYGTMLADAFAASFVTSGGAVPVHAHTLDSQADFSGLITDIQAKAPDVIYYGGIYDAGGAFAQQLRTAGVNAPIMGGDGLLDSRFISNATSVDASGVIATTVGLPPNHLPNGADFLAAYAARYPGRTLTDADAYAYDSTRVILSAIVAEAQTRGVWVIGLSGWKKETIARISATNTLGATGQISFDPTGQRRQQDIAYYKVVGGTWAYQGAR